MNAETKGLFFGFVGVVIFGLTLPFTRIAVAELDPLFVSIARTVVAGLAAAPLLWLQQAPRPDWADLKQLAIIAAGVIFGFPILSAIAMTTVPASHGGVVLGALPLFTAAMSTAFAGERPSLVFWFWALLGSTAVISFAVWDNGFELHLGDTLLIAAALAAAMGYAAGGNLSRKLGGWQVICWGLVISLPVTGLVTAFMLPHVSSGVSWEAWGAFLYLALMSQLVGFFAWNKGLAMGGVARVGQVQLLQIFVTLAGAALILGEELTWKIGFFAGLVALCVWFGRRAAVRRL